MKLLIHDLTASEWEKTADEVVGTLMRDRRRSLWPARNAESCIARLAETQTGRQIREKVVEQR